MERKLGILCKCDKINYSMYVYCEQKIMERLCTTKPTVFEMKLGLGGHWTIRHLVMDVNSHRHDLS